MNFNILETCDIDADSGWEILSHLGNPGSNGTIDQYIMRRTFLKAAHFAPMKIFSMPIQLCYKKSNPMISRLN